MLTRRGVISIFGLLCFILLAVMTALASPLKIANTYLPLLILQHPSATPAPTGLLLITELLYNPLNEPVREPAGEWVEIYNPGPAPILLAAYKLGDETDLGGSEGMLQFPAGAILNPGEVIVVANQGAAFELHYGFPPDFEMNDSDPQIVDMRPYPIWSTGKIELVNSGDEILLLDGQDTVVDALSWGSSAWELAFDPPPPPAGDGESLERSPAYTDSDSAADWKIAATPGPYQLDLATPTPTASATAEIPTGPTRLLVSEVLYDPSGQNPVGEWIEIYNAGENHTVLSDYRLGDEETQGAGEGMYTFPDGYLLLSGEVAVIANQAVVFETNYGFKPNFEIVDSDPVVPNMLKDPTWASGAMNLSANGDDVILLGGDDSIIDGVSWGNSTAILDPAVPVVDPDHAIERYPPSADTDQAADWRDQPNPVPGQIDFSTPTPTPSPTVTTTPEPLPDLIINEIHADPDAVLGDANGDGHLDTSKDEFVEIVNTTQGDIDIGGWQIHDNTGVRHVFTDTLVIPAGCAVVVFGGGTPTGDFGNAVVTTSSSGLLGLNNSGDIVTLYDLGSVVVDTYVYGAEGGDNQSITRDPDITGPDPLVKHSQATNSNGALFSPGTQVDGDYFAGCTAHACLKSMPQAKTWHP